MNAFDHFVTSEAGTTRHARCPRRRSVLKERPTLDEHFRAFIAHSPFLLMATSDADGTCDVSPKGDAPGFVLVLDDRRIGDPRLPLATSASTG